MAQDDVVAGIVALGKRAEDQGAERGRIAVRADLRGDRLVEQGQVGTGDRDAPVEIQRARIGPLQSSDRHPEFADALLREEAAAVPAAHQLAPAVNVAHGDADFARKAPAQLADAGRQGALGSAVGNRAGGGIAGGWLGGRSEGKARRQGQSPRADEPEKSAPHHPSDAPFAPSA